MNDEHYNGDDAIPVLSDVVIPGTPPVEPVLIDIVTTITPHIEAAVEPAPSQEPSHNIQSPLLAERLNSLAAGLIAEMDHRIERMVEEELARAHAMAFETARVSLQHRLRNEMETRLAAFIEEALNPSRT